jgi:hypothetical protein
MDAKKICLFVADMIIGIVRLRHSYNTDIEDLISNSTEETEDSSEVTISYFKKGENPINLLAVKILSKSNMKFITVFPNARKYLPSNTFKDLKEVFHDIGWWIKEKYQD